MVHKEMQALKGVTKLYRDALMKGQWREMAKLVRIFGLPTDGTMTTIEEIIKHEALAPILGKAGQHKGLEKGQWRMGGNGRGRIQRRRCV